MSKEHLVLIGMLRRESEELCQGGVLIPILVQGGKVFLCPWADMEGSHSSLVIF